MSLLDPSIDDLPVPVMVDILSRLPVKTIIHCKCVTKKWLNIVLDSYFGNLHLSRSPAGLMIHHNSEREMTGHQKPGILKWVEVEDELDHHHLQHDPVMCLDLDLASIFQDSEIMPVGSVNGLLCLWQFGRNKDSTYICNPITREYMIIPRQQYSREGFASITYGFGLVIMTKEYKVIRIFQRNIPPTPISASRLSLLEAEVYTLGTGQWRSLGHVPYRLKGFHGLFLNGHAHWTVADQDSPEKICAFDFEKERFYLFPSPPTDAMNESLGVINGCLYRCDTHNFKFTVWVMKEYGIKKSWHKEFVIERSISPNLDLLTMNTVYIIEGLKDGTILMASYQDILFVFCPRRKTIIDMEIYNPYFNGLAYCPSFLRLDKFKNERVHVF